MVPGGNAGPPRVAHDKKYFRCSGAGARLFGRRKKGAIMKVNWKRGFFRVWILITIIWIAVLGWAEFGGGLPWIPPFQTEGECWDRFAKWPDGSPLNALDAYFDETSDGNVEHDRLRAEIRQKLADCESHWSLARRVASKLVFLWHVFGDSLGLVFLPPVGLLLVGYAFGRVIGGFQRV